MPNRIIIGLLGMALASAPISSHSQTSQQIKRVGEFYSHTDGFSGNVVVFRDGSIVSDESYGLANIELGVANTAKTRFAIGSLTKQFTAASILLLQEQGLLKTTDTLFQHYPAVPEQWKNVTLRELLQHTSGLPDALENFGPAAFEQSQRSPEEMIKSAAAKPLRFLPGSRMEYNNMGYVLLGLIVQNVSKQPYDAFLREHFFVPLQMKDSGLGYTGGLIKDRAYGYEPVAGGLRTADPVPFTSNFSAGAIYSTGEDVARWLIALHGGRVLKPSSYIEMTTASQFGYGYGVMLDKQAGKTDISHSGRVSGFASEAEYFPELRSGIVILSNKLSHNSSPGAIALKTDLMHLATEEGAAVRSLGGERHVEPALLSRYTGTYRTGTKSEEVSVIVEVNGDHLRLTPAGKGSSTLIARSDATFYMKEWDGEAVFHQDSKGNWLLDIFTLPNETMLTLEKNRVKE